MSQLGSLITGFQNLQAENNWTDEVTTENFIKIIHCIEWELVDFPKENVDLLWNKYVKKEKDCAMELLGYK